jgi:hypothetical protein
MVGSMIPFAKTKAEREKSGDPRPSIEERYKSREDYVHRVELAADALVRARLLLERDAPKVTGRAGVRYDSIQRPSADR